MKLIRFCVICCIIVAVSNPVNGLDNATSVEKSEDLARITSMGNGFLVWESNRTDGIWRLYRMELDGTGLRQISPNEIERGHFCPHISPDGKRLVYLSYPINGHSYNKHASNVVVPMHIMNSNGSSNRILIPNARAYGADRAVVWIDNDRFIYIDGNGITCEYSISKNISTSLSAATWDGFGWLINAQKTWAAPGWPATFHPYNADTKEISAVAEMGGCQPYFSSDGNWGFWMSGSGGPISKYNLATGKISPILAFKDPRMPADRNYVYFPMISHNRRLIAFAASPNQHAHFGADYDIFIAPIDPQTLELTANPVRYTFDPGCDRFPDVYISGLDLGTYSGEAPLTVKFTPKGTKQNWQWKFGDGTSAVGSVQSHKYVKPGTYSVSCSAGDVTLHGRVTITPAISPDVLSASIVSEKQVIVMFSEPVDLSKAKFLINGRQKVGQFALTKNKLSASLSLTKPVSKGDKVRIEGVTDLAQVPNKMQVKMLEIKTCVWPSNKTGLVMLWENGKKGCVTGSGERFPVQANGRACMDNRYSLWTAGGNYSISAADEKIMKACKESNQLSIEMTVKADNLEQSGPARIITLSSSTGSRNFTIGQDKDKLTLRLRTSETGENGSSLEIALCKITAGKPQHVIVTYKPSELTCYVDGKQELKTDSIKGDFNNWNNQHLLIGDEWEGQRSWHGTVEGIALYNRTISATEASQNYESYAALHPVKSISPLKVTAKLVSVSPLPTLNEIKPYRQALVLNEYKVEKILQGKCKAQKIRVAQWAILGGVELNKKSQPGSTATLVLEPFEQNPQLASTYTSDTLDPNPDIPVYVDLAM